MTIGPQRRLVAGCALAAALAFVLGGCATQRPQAEGLNERAAIEARDCRTEAPPPEGAGRSEEMLRWAALCYGRRAVSERAARCAPGPLVCPIAGPCFSFLSGSTCHDESTPFDDWVIARRWETKPHHSKHQQSLVKITVAPLDVLRKAAPLDVLRDRERLDSVLDSATAVRTAAAKRLHEVGPRLAAPGAAPEAARQVRLREEGNLAVMEAALQQARANIKSYREAATDLSGVAFAGLLVAEAGTDVSIKRLEQVLEEYQKTLEVALTLGSMGP